MSPSGVKGNQLTAAAMSPNMGLTNKKHRVPPLSGQQPSKPIIEYLNIEFSEFKHVDIMIAPKKQQINDGLAPLQKYKRGFQLMKNYEILTFATSNEEELDFWHETLRPFIFQRDIWSSYIFSKELGEGTYGKVFLATSREFMMQQVVGKNNFSGGMMSNKKVQLMDNLILCNRITWLTAAVGNWGQNQKFIYQQQQLLSIWEQSAH